MNRCSLLLVLSVLLISINCTYNEGKRKFLLATMEEALKMGLPMMPENMLEMQLKMFRMYAQNPQLMVDEVFNTCGEGNVLTYPDGVKCMLTEDGKKRIGRDDLPSFMECYDQNQDYYISKYEFYDFVIDFAQVMLNALENAIQKGKGKKNPMDDGNMFPGFDSFGDHTYDAFPNNTYDAFPNNTHDTFGSFDSFDSFDPFDSFDLFDSFDSFDSFGNDDAFQRDTFDLHGDDVWQTNYEEPGPFDSFDSFGRFRENDTFGWNDTDKRGHKKKLKEHRGFDDMDDFEDDQWRHRGPRHHKRPFDDFEDDDQWRTHGPHHKKRPFDDFEDDQTRHRGPRHHKRPFDDFEDDQTRHHGPRHHPFDDFEDDDQWKNHGPHHHKRPFDDFEDDDQWKHHGPHHKRHVDDFEDDDHWKHRGPPHQKRPFDDFEEDDQWKHRGPPHHKRPFDDFDDENEFVHPHHRSHPHGHGRGQRYDRPDYA